MNTPVAATDVDRGRLLASLLCRSWQQDVEASSLSPDELDCILPLVLTNGTAALAWRRIRGTPFGATEGGRKIQQARLSLAVQAAIGETQVDRLFAGEGLRAADPILIKGWAHSRLFPDPVVRPYSDIDVFIRAEHYGAAVSAYGSTFSAVDSLGVFPMDLHTEWVDLPDRTWSEIHAHSCVVAVRASRVRILGPEDALRLACYHLLRHAIELTPKGTPLWLCDIGVMLENLAPSFDWDYCLAGHRRRTQWILAVIRMANQVVGAAVTHCPEERLPQSVPSWMQKTFFRLWGHRDVRPRSLPRPLGSVRRDIRELPRALAERWPSPLQSVYRLPWPINRVPAPVAQVVDYTARALTWGPRQVSNRRVVATVG